MRRGQCTPRCAGFGVFRHLVAWTFAIAILILWIASAVAAPITLRVVEISPVYAAEGRPSFFVKVDGNHKRWRTTTDRFVENRCAATGSKASINLTKVATI